jgi:hypothetical protein
VLSNSEAHRATAVISEKAEIQALNDQKPPLAAFDFEKLIAGGSAPLQRYCHACVGAAPIHAVIPAKAGIQGFEWYRAPCARSQQLLVGG